ncbi:hypothetical protein LguiA_023560 [Lonicera macranthoides]
MKFTVRWVKCLFSNSMDITTSKSTKGQVNIHKIHAFTYNELKVATCGFRSSNKIGEGGFGAVYKGTLPDGKIVAVKVLSLESKQGEKEFMSEISSISNIGHENLVKLHGGCVERGFRILVYDYMENNSLAQTLLEYAITGHITRKADVYSFGVLLLEMVSGRSAVDFDVELGEHYLVEKAWDMYKGNKLVELVDPMLKGNFNEREALRFIKVGLLCVQEIGRSRPHVSTAIKMMNGEIKIDDLEIQQPGLITDIMDVKIGRGSSSQSTNSSNPSPFF